MLVSPFVETAAAGDVHCQNCQRSTGAEVHSTRLAEPGNHARIPSGPHSVFYRIAADLDRLDNGLLLLDWSTRMLRAS
jgi:hypothetical protein